MTHQVDCILFFKTPQRLILNLTELISSDILSSLQPINENTLTCKNVHNCCPFLQYLFHFIVHPLHGYNGPPFWHNSQ